MSLEESNPMNKNGKETASAGRCKKIRNRRSMPLFTPAPVWPGKTSAYSLSKAKKFELPLYSGEAKRVILFDQPGVVTIGCNIHDWMIAYVVVLPTPHFAKTGADGTAALSVPAGRYHLEIWQPRLAQPLTQEITVTTDTAPTSLAFTLALKPDRRIPQPADDTEDNPY